MSEPVSNVSIVGAGLGGLAAAIEISRAGHKVIILEQARVLSESASRSQGAEDGAVLGALFMRIEHALTIYEPPCKNRTITVAKGSTRLRDIFHIPDGPQQQERDQHLMQGEPSEGYPNPWADSVFQPYLFRYDTDKEVEDV
ncbi:MAG: hypothetical protein Q9225_003395 [Loekoesia sp. 1 TL-2023]